MNNEKEKPLFQFISKTGADIKTYLCDKEQRYNRIIHFARLSILINAVIGLGKIIMGFHNQSFLFSVGGFYNIGLSLAKTVAVKGYCESKGGKIWSFTPAAWSSSKSGFLLRPDRQADNSFSEKSKKNEYRYYQLVGLIVLLASLAYMVGSIRVLVGESGNAQYSSLMVVEIGFITAFEIILSLQGVFARRREKEPILEAIKLTSFISSLIGLVLVQTAVLGYTGREPNIYFDILGIFLGAVSSCIGIYMIVLARIKMIKNLNKRVMRIRR